jgi:uroporphyrinogen III methyltransferase / synthase
VAETHASALRGKRIVITRAAAQSEALSKQLSVLGAIPVILPLVAFTEPEDFAPLDEALAQIENFDWVIFTSGQAVRAVVARSQHTASSLGRAGSKLHIATVGPVSAEAVRQADLPVDYVANTHSGVALAEELGERLQGRSVLLPRSDRANPDLPVALQAHGAHVTEVVAYRTLQPSEVDTLGLSRISAGEADAILFFSPSAVQHFAELAGVEQLRRIENSLAITAVGPVTASALREAGAERLVVAADTTAVAVIQALEKHFAGTAKPSAAGVERG